MGGSIGILEKTVLANVFGIDAGRTRFRRHDFTWRTWRLI